MCECGEYTMQEDVERIYAANIRLTGEAYDLLLSAKVEPLVIDRILRSEEAIIDIDFIKSAMAEESKIPMPSHVHANEDERKEAEKAKIASEKKYVHAQRETPPPQQKTGMPPVEIKLAPSGGKAPAAETRQAIVQAASQPISETKPAPAQEAAQHTFETKPGTFSLLPSEAEVARRKSFRPLAAEYSSRITIFDNHDVSGQSRCTGTVDDFVKHFRDRFERESDILRQRPSGIILARTDQLGAHQNQDVRLLCMVYEKKITSKGNLLLELEDEQGRIRAVVSSKEKIFNEAKTLLKDDVVAIDGKQSGDWFMVKAVTWPDLPIIREQKHAETDVAVAYLSDLHIGSRYFLEKPFKKFIRWLWGEEGNAELAGKVKYVVIAGDICDGIGVYPMQEKELVVKDIFAQYKMFDDLIQSFPDHIVTVVGPGNHDAVRRAEPQPYIPMDMIKSDVKKIGSPAILEIEGLKHLVYHGTSIDSIIANISGLSYSKPDGPMVEMLKRRHLSPIYGENLIVPEHRDYMMIEEEPDIVHMGHIHKNAARKYRGTLLINSGTFQERTEFQVKMGHVPTPGIVPVLEMKSGNLSHLNFLGS